jgi:hypothetical protein
MHTFLFLLGSFMALPFDTPPHRTAPQLTAAADASNVSINTRKAAHVAALIHALKGMKVDPVVSQSAGPGFADTLAALVGGEPRQLSMGTEGTDFGDYWPRSNTMAVTPFDFGLARRSQPQVRATMAHEFGHILDLLTPGLREEFLKRNPKFPAQAAWSGAGNTGVTGEVLSDAFAQAVRGIIPQVGEESAYNYRFSPDLINARQQALLDSLVQARAKYLPR